MFVEYKLNFFFLSITIIPFIISYIPSIRRYLIRVSSGERNLIIPILPAIPLAFLMGIDNTFFGKFITIIFMLYFLFVYSIAFSNYLEKDNN
ncbi:hypothetical protein CS022_18270 [Veronia nyctiphanis]|uniref:Uncharacterized protein n=1 Tax=Veronia nyctiphanis TaxID=1278244 RepID=A0A4Q0YMI5_9GAMM|nr:hypothetical protein CS022_17990 [Veronia nyctiphanis]RXJ72072.1 hypothetical protein CS022_18270 [Veronia nyctiphanis]